jgi:hypothetical protein
MNRARKLFAIGEIVFSIFVIYLLFGKLNASRFWSYVCAADSGTDATQSCLSANDKSLYLHMSDYNLPCRSAIQ